MKIPKSPAEITAEWLDSVLFSKTSNSEIASIEIDKDFGPWSLLGKAVRIKISYTTSGCEPKSVIVKFQVSVSEPKREGEIYSLLFEEKVLCVPRIYGEFGNGNLVMEDMTPTHSVLKDDLTITQIQNVVSTLADLQTRFFDDSRVPKYDLSHFVNAIRINMQSWDIFKKRYQDQLGNESADFEWILKNPEVVSSHYNSNPGSLSHGDVNKANLLFPNDGSNSPIFIDWQLSAQRIIPFDLCYFIVKQLTVEQRRKHENALLKEYYELLSDKIKASYSFNHLVLDYRACVTRSMLSAVMRVGPRFENQPNRFKKADELATRVIEAVRDLKSIEAIQELKEQGFLEN
ncbi:MAG: hypothetical protein UR66_C0005G0031 [Candidatus Moranbacteria bacterium GW2011_GWE1_35_17]|nr:MAG: hypothetical protein UR66_C0005G0031 [Candidatus Moranbacteria bacterium GW2011_GWE1_35_17]KKP84030.1 MAG: hypothetical protein UR82_C0014G0009 [Candidatus Moranbacteria bacterium GW2011_GWF1_35_5]